MKPSRADRWSWLSFPVSAATFAVLRIIDPGGRHENPLLVALLNTFLISGISFVVALLGARAYLKSGETAELLLGCGAFVFGSSAIITGFLIEDLDVSVTTFTVGAALAASYYLASAAMALGRRISRLKAPARPWMLVLVYAPAIFAIVATAVAASREALPHFYLPDLGPSAVRQFVTGAAVALFLSAAITFGAVSARSGKPLLRWFAGGLGLIALGLAGQGFATPGTAPDWVGRSAMYLGCIYIFIAAARAARESGIWAIPIEEALRESEERLRIAYKAAHAGTWEWDLESGALAWSPEIYGLCGVVRTGEPPSYEDWLAVVHASDRPRLAEELQASVARRCGMQHEYRVVRPDDGRVRWLLSFSTLLLGPSGNPSRMVGFTMDVTARKNAELQVHARNRIAEIFLSAPTDQVFSKVLEVVQEVMESPLGVFGSVDERGEVTIPAFSKEAGDSCPAGKTRALPHQRWTGPWRQALLEGQSMVSNQPRKVPPGHPPINCVLSVPIVHQDKLIGLYEVANRPGGYGPEEVAFLEGLATQAASLLHERLERLEQEQEREVAEQALKASDERLRALNAELEERVTERTAVARRQVEQLRELASELASAEQKERQRLAKLLHDHLQQMLAAARLHIGIISGRTADPDALEASAQVDQLLAQSIEESRALAFQLSPPVLRDGGLAAGLEWLARDMRGRHGLEVELCADPEADVPDEDGRVLLFDSARELLSNVIKHSGVMHARVHLARGDGHTVLTVEDDGRGFDPAKLRSAGARTGGFGLFSLQQRLELLGGEVSIAGSPGCVRIRLSLPLKGPEGGKRGARKGVPRSSKAGSRPAGKPGSSIRVLLADDHQIMRQGLVILLESERDMEVVGEAQDGEEAVALALRLRPDVVVMDVSMPKLNGVEATRRICSALPGVKVIGLSMFDEAAIESALRQAGACAYLTKGGPSEALVRSIREAALRECSGESG